MVGLEFKYVYFQRLSFFLSTSTILLLAIFSYFCYGLCNLIILDETVTLKL